DGAVTLPDQSTTRVMWNAVTGNFFSALGLRPLLGRLIQPADEHNSEVAVLGYASCSWVPARGFEATVRPGVPADHWQRQEHAMGRYFIGEKSVARSHMISALSSVFSTCSCSFIAWKSGSALNAAQFFLASSRLPWARRKTNELSF